ADEGRGRGRPVAARVAEEPARAGDGDARDRRELRLDAARRERARRRLAGARRGRGRVARPGGAGPVTGAAATEPTEARRTIRIGLTGPIGCGKSTVAGWLAERGAVVVDADEVARDVTAPGQPSHDAVIARFGDPVRGPDGTLDRAALARIVFADDASLADLEAIVHPAVRPAILAAVASADQATAPAVVIEALKLAKA